jgi:hypothetical protein
MESSVLKSLLDYRIELRSFLFLQRARTSNLANKNKEVVGVTLILSHYSFSLRHTFFLPQTDFFFFATT